MRKETARMAACVLGAALAVSGVSVPGSSAGAAAKPKLGKTSATLYTGAGKAKKSTTLQLKVGGKKASATWKSSKKSIATVSKAGKVTAKKAGSAKITATYKGKTYTCKVTVKKYKAVTGLTVKPKTITLKAGKTKQLTVTVTPKKATEKGVTYTSSNKNVATVSKTGKITAKKAGKATIKIKTAGVKANGNAMSKTVTVVVTEDAAEPTAEPDNSTEPTQAPDDTTAPSTEPSADPSAAPSQAPDVIGVPETIEGNVTNSLKQYENTVMANQSATVKFVVTDKDGKPVQNETVTVTQATYSVDNHFIDHYVGTTFVKGDARAEYMLKGENKVEVVTTDENGVARVVLAPKEDLEALAKNRDDFNLEDAVANYRLTAVCASDEKVTKQLNVRVGAVTYQAKDDKGKASGNSVLEITAAGKKAAGTNASDLDGAYSDYVNASDWRTPTTTDANELGVDYVSTQQASQAGSDEHAVTFRTNACLKLPGITDDRTGATTQTSPINWNSGEYHPYGNTDKQNNGYLSGEIWYVLPVDLGDPSDINYATLNFEKIELSKGTKMEVIVGRKNSWHPDDQDSIATYMGKDKAYSTKNESLQIKHDDLMNIAGIGIRIKPYGQVNTAQNSGVVIKDLTTVYKTQSGTKATYEPLDGVSFKWEEVTPAWDKEETLPNNTCGVTYDAALGESATYTVPTFPNVGNAIISVKNSKGEVIKYYAAATKNYKDVNGKIKNKNELETGKKAYRITEDEAKVMLGASLTENAEGNEVTVNSEKAGTTFLKATVTSDGSDEHVVLDALNKEVYTSIMWNPVASVVDTAGFIAIDGQTVTVKGQLIDKNGNAVSKDEIGVKFWDSSNDGELTKGSTPYGNDAKYGAETAYTDAKATDTGEDLSDTATHYVEVSDQTKTTDKNGCVEMKLTGHGTVDLIGLNASSADPRYDVRLTVNGQTTNKADIYWMDLYLQYHTIYHWKNWETKSTPYLDWAETRWAGYPCPDDNIGSFRGARTSADGVTPVVYANGDKGVFTIPADRQTWNVGEKWELGVRVVAYGAMKNGIFKRGGNGDVQDVIDGVTVKIDGNKEQVKASDKIFGTAEVTSKTATAGTVSFSIDKDSVGKNTVIRVPLAAGGDREVTIAADTPAVNAVKQTMNIGYKFEEEAAHLESKSELGEKFSLSNKKHYYYVKAVNKDGSPMIGATLNVTPVNATLATGSDKVTTDSDGVARIELLSMDANQTTARLDIVLDNTTRATTSTDVKTSITITKTVNETPFEICGARFDEDMKAIILTFTQEVLPDSVQKEQFGLVTTGAIGDQGTLAPTDKYSVVNAKASGKEVILTLNWKKQDVTNDITFAFGYKPYNYSDEAKNYNSNVVYAITSKETGLSLIGNGGEAGTAASKWATNHKTAGVYDYATYDTVQVKGFKADGTSFDEKGAKIATLIADTVTANKALKDARKAAFVKAITDIATSKSFTEVEDARAMYNAMSGAEQDGVTTEEGTLQEYEDNIAKLKTAKTKAEAAVFQYVGSVATLTTAVETAVDKTNSKVGAEAKATVPSTIPVAGGKMAYTLKRSEGTATVEFTIDVEINVLSQEKTTKLSTLVGALNDLAGDADNADTMAHVTAVTTALNALKTSEGAAGAQALIDEADLDMARYDADMTIIADLDKMADQLAAVSPATKWGFAISDDADAIEAKIKTGMEFMGANTTKYKVLAANVVTADIDDGANLAVGDKVTIKVSDGTKTNLTSKAVTLFTVPAAS